MAFQMWSPDSNVFVDPYNLEEVPQEPKISNKKPKKLIQPAPPDCEYKYYRSSAGEKWVDPTLLDWPEGDYRIFVGDLGNEVNDDMLKNGFKQYSSVQRVRVIRDKFSGKSKGFGFVSFGDPIDFTRAFKEMQGKYVGNRPVKLRKGRWMDRVDWGKVQATVAQNKKQKKKKPRGVKKRIPR